MTQDYMATCPRGMESVLSKELVELGAANVQESVAAVYFSADQVTVFGICLWSRVANRVLALLCRTHISTADELYQQANKQDWSAWFNTSKTLAVDFNGTSSYVRDSRYGQQLVKDAINDHFTGHGDSRLIVDSQTPDVLVYVRLFKGKLSIGLDLVGESLHRRGYRCEGGEAPLKENLAAALLLQCGWPEIARQGGDFVDPMCGSGTLLIEAALIAANIPPSYRRENWVLQHLLPFDQALWREALAKSRLTVEQSVAGMGNRLLGCDVGEKAIERAGQNIENAGLSGCISIRRCAIADFHLRESLSPGLVLVNPPYGERLGEVEQLADLYQQLGATLKSEFNGWQAAIFTGNRELGWQTGIRSWRQHRFYNGAIECQLQRYRIEPKNFIVSRESQAQRVFDYDELNDSAKMLANRLRKNLRRLKQWLGSNAEVCYRLYNADLPEYAVAIDCYYGVVDELTEGPSTTPWRQHANEDRQRLSRLRKLRDSGGEKQLYIHVQEYAPPARVDVKLARQRIRDVLAAVSAVFGCPRNHIVLKRRQRQRGSEQYQKIDGDTPDMVVREGEACYIVNLGRYLDTGLFLDSRPVRKQIAAQVRGGHFLNLFSYTSSATVAAILAGAASTTSVDLSRTYLAWSRDNFALNGIDTSQSSPHKLEAADCTEWLSNCQDRFDCILLDPPSFSNSRRMTGTLDLERDHRELIDRSMALLAPGGTLYFVSNKRGFKIDPELAARFQVEDITRDTLDPDFEKGRPAHQCWRIRQPQNENCAK